MSESTTLFLGPEDNIAILKEAFSNGKALADDLVKKTGKNKGTILNSIHDLKILSLVDTELKVADEVKNIVYERGAKEILKNHFLNVTGNKEATDEIITSMNLDPLEVGKSFCFHTNARAAKESSLRQIGRLYLRWLKFLCLINESKSENEVKNG